MIYLASQSPRRKAILKKMGIRFKVVSSDYNEKSIKGISPEELVLRHAIGKARSAAIPEKARYILSADTIVWCRNRILGKPKTKKEAAGILNLIHGRSHTVYTGVVLYDSKMNTFQKEVARTRVFIKRLSKKDMMDYIEKVDPFDKAGSYAIQEGPRIVERIEGSYSNVMGLPKEVVKKMVDRSTETIE